ncbi:hypothetical protein HPP92_022367 [Vanilla planifolia]|uniref:Uncharacterized protein n=1 Tax=Vanilla planifolia TaxID=51239 RepID=A0A835UDK3_VANPL|nr:hypothetical protein HPP92_022367 [Vanilla planifolia]
MYGLWPSQVMIALWLVIFILCVLSPHFSFTPFVKTSVLILLHLSSFMAGVYPTMWWLCSIYENCGLAKRGEQVKPWIVRLHGQASIYEINPSLVIMEIVFTPNNYSSMARVKSLFDLARLIFFVDSTYSYLVVDTLKHSHIFGA